MILIYKWHLSAWNESVYGIKLMSAPNKPMTYENKQY